MSSLYRVRVDHVTPPKVRLTVWQIHPDAGVPPKSLTFALFVVCAPFQKTHVLQGSAPSLRSPLARAIDVVGGQYLDEAWIIANAQAFIERFSRTALKNARRSLDGLRSTTEIELEGNALTTRYGRIGTNARETKKHLMRATDAKDAFDKLITEKLAKGYRAAPRASSRQRSQPR